MELQNLIFLNFREQDSITIDLDEVAEFDEDLAEAIRGNARRYVQVALNQVYLKTC